MANRRIRVAVVFGGRSSEHAVSCVTATGVMGALDPVRYDVVPIGITRQGDWVLVPNEAANWRLDGPELPQITMDDGSPVAVPVATDRRELLVLPPGQPPQELAAVDVVFPLLHGPYGEDGTLQGMLELSDTRYVGPGVLCSALSMDKHFMKIALAAAGIPIGRYVVVKPRDWERDPDAVSAAVAELGYPVFVKPARAGSSMGVSKVDDASALSAAIEAAREHDPKLVIEAAVSGREIECGVMESLTGADPDTTLPAEIVVHEGRDFYDFEAKYLDTESVSLICPAQVPDDVVQRVQDVARRTFEAMGCEGLARVDCFVTPDGEVLVNELNTMPGFTPHSMYPRMWQSSGVSYPELLDRLVQLALRRRVGLR